MKTLPVFSAMALVGLLASVAQAGTIDVSPAVQTGIGVQNAQQIQLGFGVRNQAGTIVQQQPQFQYIGRPSRPERSYSYPGRDDIRVSPAVQTGIGVQNAQQIQLGLPDIGRPRY
ncbi:hypothetical protein [Gloeobacter kilaueensis]|uniref:Uncharacterized protein n=1 Tax=Gloeobacter kilaueensis (strain ATCC BAA-2537 / CCAP 1431/1 / ULC 316 / JS1) TaxID=1183438 RepID=U5QJ64_GLOK1|nr:hypothetical protein [Gloeobacter kilaueensis]AGY57720.1 hypothetical protein GKIL_1474 [Gloeobacter kilaueensis JS1]